MSAKGRPKMKNSKLALASWNIPFVRLVLLESRILFIIVLQCISNILIPDHDADAFKGIKEEIPGLLDPLVNYSLGGFSHWDATHFLHIAQWGYTFENNLAFFPLYPIIVGLLWRVLGLVIPPSLLSVTSGLLLCAVTVNLICFIGSAYILFLLTYATHNKCDAKIPLITLILFSVNPASVFFSSCYSESLYSFLTFLGLYCIHARGPKTDDNDSIWGIVESCVIFGLALLCRSNGLLNGIFIGFAFIQRFLNNISVLSLVSNVNYAILCAVVIFTPYVYLQHFIYKIFCTSNVVIGREIAEVALANNYTLPGQMNRLAWCFQRIPLSYNYIQAHYWNVGFMKYFQLVKIPCFILALPVIILGYSASIHFLAKLRPPKTIPWHKFWFSHKNEDSSDVVFYLPYIVHMFVVLFIGIFFINVEVVTRLVFSSNPLIYWYIAGKISSNLDENSLNKSKLVESIKNDKLWNVIKLIWSNLSSKSCRLILAYFIVYAFLGTVLHSNFLPWT